jgi:catechol 2,3-dioxygenase-like lactoylglutathione lyase family enzyme
MLEAILVVTLVVGKLEPVEHAYVNELGYQVVERSAIAPPLAASWASPAIAGSRQLLLQPQSGASTWLRIVERPHASGYRALMSFGWNANEILVQDPYALEQQFSRPDSSFKVIGPPAALGSNGSVIAMQALGPAGELNYFTRIPPEGGTFIKTPASSYVDRSFIAVLGGPNMAAMQRFYAEVLGASVTASYKAQVDVLNEAHRLPTDHQSDLAIVRISDAFILELDQYPGSAVERERPVGDLPAGLAIVSFEVADLDARPLSWLVAPQPITAAPYDGRRAGLLIGAAGELIELVERTARN